MPRRFCERTHQRYNHDVPADVLHPHELEHHIAAVLCESRADHGNNPRNRHRYRRRHRPVGRKPFGQQQGKERQTHILYALVGHTLRPVLPAYLFPARVGLEHYKRHMGRCDARSLLPVLNALQHPLQRSAGRGRRGAAQESFPLFDSEPALCRIVGYGVLHLDDKELAHGKRRPRDMGASHTVHRVLRARRNSGAHPVVRHKGEGLCRAQGVSPVHLGRFKGYGLLSELRHNHRGLSHYVDSVHLLQHRRGLLHN